MAGDNLTNGNGVAADVQEAVDQFSTDAGELAREIREKADEARKTMVRTLNDSALNMRRQTRELGAADEVVTAIDDVAKGFEKAASYLNNHTVDAIGRDVQKTVRQNSTWLIVAMLVIGVIIGLLLRGDDKK